MKKLNHIILGLLVTLIIACTNKKKEAIVTETKPEEVNAKRFFPKLDSTRYNVAFLIMNGTFNTEFTAPFDIFQHTKFRENIKAMNVFTVANTLEPITTFEGVRILPDYNYIEDVLPKIDILVVPSAEHQLDSDLKDAAMLNFVKKVNKDALFITSHCDGAFVLAKAGVLDSVTSTTFPSDIELYKKTFPHLKVADNALFVHDKKYITSAGGAKSFEAALYLCEYLYGKEVAQSLAGGLVIDWDVNNVPHLIIP
ncbi:DJ-1/PfpI family protein [Cellulophaga fucicola]|uniref:DJ-1/PfpI family protein n=1 Tax=Cellulophaga fucicola TaxID=76595 RepID=A0A1K1R0Z1_9FLAO|nr:DJ-1/PfpI family protein [Cellulophaga fucicola]SFW65585.1 DJ-1/PfpI family protein [Cellulophaga fucicola]